MFENYMVNRNGCKVVIGGLLMGAVWLTSSSLRLATLAHSSLKGLNCIAKFEF